MSDDAGRAGAAGGPPGEAHGSWREYQQPLRWSWSAALVLVGLVLGGLLLAAALVGRL